MIGELRCEGLRVIHIMMLVMICIIYNTTVQYFAPLRSPSDNYGHDYGAWDQYPSLRLTTMISTQWSTALRSSKSMNNVRRILCNVLRSVYAKLNLMLLLYRLTQRIRMPLILSHCHFFRSFWGPGYCLLFQWAELAVGELSQQQCASPCCGAPIVLCLFQLDSIAYNSHQWIPI